MRPPDPVTRALDAYIVHVDAEIRRLEQMRAWWIERKSRPPSEERTSQ